MAAHQESHGNAGSMDIKGHMKTWVGFTKFVKYSMVGIVLVMIFLAIFRTHS